MPLGSEIQIGLPQLPEGVPPELFNHFLGVYNALHNLGRQLSLYGGVDPQDSSVWDQITPSDTVLIGNLNRMYVKQNEALLFGEVVSPINVAGELQVRKANATDNTKWACGVVSSGDHVSAVGSFCEIRVGAWLCDGIAGLTVGARYWLSTTNGLVANVPATAAGNIEQFIGWAVSSSRLLMQIDGNFIQH